MVLRANACAEFMRAGTENGKWRLSRWPYEDLLIDGGTTWKLNDRPQPKSWDRESEPPLSKTQRIIRLQRRSFLWMCAVAFCGDALTDNVPKPPAVIRKEVDHAVATGAGSPAIPCVSSNSRTSMRRPDACQKDESNDRNFTMHFR